MRLMTPGIYDNMSNADYHASEGISSTGIKQVLRSPAHYKYSSFETSEAMKFGTVAHKLALEPDDFENEFILVPPEIPKNKGTKKYKEWAASVES